MIWGVGHAFLRISANSDAFSKFARYEATIECGMYKALHELQGLQADRRANDDDFPAPLAVAVDIGENSA